jgi:ketosteroid isomerase-like protein
MSAVHTQRESDEAQIKQQVARIAEGIRAKDLESLRPIYATDIVSFDVEPPLQHVGVEAKLKNWANVFAAFQDVNYEVRDLSVAVSDDVAFGHYFGRLHGTLRTGRRPRASGSGSRPASGNSTAPGRSCTTRLRCRSTCSAAEEWPTSNPDCSEQPVWTHPSKFSWPSPCILGPDQLKTRRGEGGTRRVRRPGRGQGVGEVFVAEHVELVTSM